MGVRVGVDGGIDENNTLQPNFLSSMKIVSVKGLSGLWALEWAWKIFGGPDHEYIYFMVSEIYKYFMGSETVVFFFK